MTASKFCMDNKSAQGEALHAKEHSVSNNRAMGEELKTFSFASRKSIICAPGPLCAAVGKVLIGGGATTGSA
jgi:hypothetical protein